MIIMADIESRVDNLEEKYSNLHTAVNVMAAKVDAVSEKIDLVVGEMRQQNLLRAKEIAELRSKHDEDMKAIAKQREADKAAHEAEMKEINNRIDEKFEKILSQMQNMAIAVVVGVGAIVWAVVSALR